MDNLSLEVMLYLMGSITFLSATAVCLKNYWRTRGITNYWSFVTIVAALGTVWAGSFLVDTFGVSLRFLSESQLLLAGLMLIGYTASMTKAVSDDIVTEVV